MLGVVEAGTLSVLISRSDPGERGCVVRVDSDVFTMSERGCQTCFWAPGQICDQSQE